MGVLGRALIVERNVTNRKENFEWKDKKQNFNKGTTSMSKKFKWRSSGNTGLSQSGNSTPACTTCGMKHGGVCRRTMGACYQCGRMGHMAKDCTQSRPNGNRGATSSIGSAPTTKLTTIPSISGNEQR